MRGQKKRLGRVEVVEEDLADRLLLLLLVALRLDALLLDCKVVSKPNSKSEDGERTQLLPAESLGVGVEAEENTLVDEGVLVLRPGALLVLRVCGANDRLNLVAVDETGDIGVGDLRRRKAVVWSELAHVPRDRSKLTCSPS